MKKLFVILLTVVLILSIMFLFSTGCKSIGTNISDKISKEATEKAKEKSDSGFPDNSCPYRSKQSIKCGPGSA